MRNRLLIHIFLGLFFVSCDGLKHHNKLDDITNTKEIERLFQLLTVIILILKSILKLNLWTKTVKNCMILYK
jgi:hypothetical protein